LRDGGGEEVLRLEKDGNEEEGDDYVNDEDVDETHSVEFHTVCYLANQPVNVVFELLHPVHHLDVFYQHSNCNFLYF
jgi:hypothetical protein